MKREELMEHVGKMIRYLSNTLLGISILVFISGLAVSGMEIYSDQLFWTQLNSMWIVVIMLILVENFYLQKDVKKKPTRKKKSK